MWDRESGPRAWIAGVELSLEYVTSASVVTQAWVHSEAICGRSWPGFAMQTICDVV